MTESEKELLENFRSMSAENQINMLPYAHATRLAEITTKRRYGFLSESYLGQKPVNKPLSENGYENLAI